MKKWNWKHSASKADIKAHISSLNAAIRYYENRNKAEMVSELTAEKESLKEFFQMVK